MYAVCGILFNHESPRRGLEFVTRRISDGVARIKLGVTDRLVLGDLDARRDWGYAPDYVRAMWLMMQADEPLDYVIGTGVTHSVRDFVEHAFGAVDLDWRDYVKVDEALLRPRERCQLVADPARANERLDWYPAMSFGGLVEVMVEADLERLSPSGAYA
jgi:GDPmannose 4,6-dehydratase